MSEAKKWAGSTGLALLWCVCGILVHAFDVPIGWFVLLTFLSGFILGSMERE